MLGQVLSKALGDKKGLVRYGHFHLAMDETLVRVALDFSGRSLLVWRLPKGTNLNRLKAGDFPAQLTVEFLRGFVQQAGLTLHTEVLYSDEDAPSHRGGIQGRGPCAGTGCPPRSTRERHPSTKGLL